MHTTGALALAAEHDAAGNHDEAINELARAAARGDLRARTELGKRLVAGDRAPLLPRDGVGLLLEAFRAGDAEAAARLAALAALGAHMPQSWPTALRLLVFAAEHGSELARGQLATLAGKASSPAAADPAAHSGRLADDAKARTGRVAHDAEVRTGSAAAALCGRAADTDWAALASAIDLGAWLEPPAGITLHDVPAIRAFPALVPPHACDWLIGRARGGLHRALIYSAAHGEHVADPMRSNRAAGFDLTDTDLVQIAIQYRMASAVGLPVSNMEGPTVLHYEPGQQITDHFDFLNPGLPIYAQELAARGERIITFLAYLNDDYDAGETDFPRLGVRHKGRRGSGLFFVNALPDGRPDLRTVHAGRPPTRGEKWIVSQFFRSQPAWNARAERIG